MDDFIRNEDASFDNKQKAISKDELLGPITDLPAYSVDVQSLDCPELEPNPIYQRLKQRILKFFVTREEIRRYGPTRKQNETNFKAGIDFSYWIQVYRSLKRMLREVIRCHDPKIQTKHLGKVYAWFMRRLEAIGQLSNAERDDEQMILNPAKIDEL